MKAGKTETCPTFINPPLFIVFTVVLSFAAENLWAQTAEEIEASV